MKIKDCLYFLFAVEWADAADEKVCLKKFFDGLNYFSTNMPVRTEVYPVDPPLPYNSNQPGVTRSLLYNGSRFQGHQKSKGKSYDVEVVLKVCKIIFEQFW